MFFHSWPDVWRAVAVSAIFFLTVVVLLRLAGQQSLAKMSGYDVVFTITLGSVLATVAVTRSITLSEGFAAVATMLVLQEVIRHLQARFLGVHHMVRQAPTVVVWDGQLLGDRLKKEAVSADEVRAAVRKAGLRSISDAQAVVLENDGEWSVIPASADESDDSALHGLPIPGRPENTRDKDGAYAEAAPATRIP
jgi:uncharacterized membrane protein YcaP (DUF421 family)